MSAAPGGTASLSIVWLWLLATLGGQPGPQPGLAPGEVIRTVIEALQNCNSPAPNAGIFTAYQFASPANRVNSGPYGKFLRLVRVPGFAPLISGPADSYGPLIVDGNRAEQAVRFRVGVGRGIWFRFVVSRQTSEQTRGHCTGCWMVDAVIPMPDEP